MKSKTEDSIRIQNNCQRILQCFIAHIVFIIHTGSPVHCVHVQGLSRAWVHSKQQNAYSHTLDTNYEKADLRGHYKWILPASQQWVTKGTASLTIEVSGAI